MRFVAWRLECCAELRALPHDFPPGKTVSNTFWRWRNDGVWQRIHDTLRERVRQAEGKKKTPTAAIIDGQTVKTTEVGGGERGYDAREKASGRKRHSVVDAVGLVLAVVVHAASVEDCDGPRTVLAKLKQESERLKVIFADSAYGRNG